MKTEQKNISPQQAKEWLEKGEAVLIDVREPDEFSATHIPYALSMPITHLQDAFHALGIPHDRKIIFQCLQGGRGERACSLVQSQHQFYNIEGGIKAWQNAGLPVIGSRQGKLSIFRQVQIIVGALVACLVAVGFMGVTLAFAIVGLLGGALLFAGITGWCGLAMLLNKAPWNKP